MITTLSQQNRRRYPQTGNTGPIFFFSNRGTTDTVVIPPPPLTPTASGKPEDVLVYLLKTNAAVYELVYGSSFRIVPDQLPIHWKDKTSIVYEQTGEKRLRAISGAESLYHTKFAVYCVDRNRGKSRILAAAVREALAINRRQIIAGHLVHQVFVTDGERDENIPSQDGQEMPERCRVIDCVVHHTSE